MNSWNQRSLNNNTLGGLLILSTTSSVVTMAFSFFLWRKVSQLQHRLEHDSSSFEDESSSGKRRRSKRLSSHHHNHNAIGGDRSLLITDTGTHAPPELVLGEDAELPIRFKKAGKDDEEEGRRRFIATLEWRERHEINTCLYRAWPDFELIKSNYPHYYHSFGKNGEPVFFEQPPKTDLKALRAGGVDMKGLLEHYAMICEFQWQYIARDDEQKSIYIVDMEGMGMYDFAGECKDFVKEAAQFASAHYPERAGVVLVINVPYYFKMAWNVVKKWVDPVTLEKIFILRGKEEILQTLLDRIPVENIPTCYGGESPYELGNSPEEQLLKSLMKHNNEMAETGVCPHAGTKEPCQFCNFRYARNF